MSREISEDMIIYAAVSYSAAGFSYSVTTDHYVSSDDFRSATEAEATAVMDKYTHETLAFTPFVV